MMNSLNSVNKDTTSSASVTTVTIQTTTSVTSVTTSTTSSSSSTTSTISTTTSTSSSTSTTTSSTTSSTSSTTSTTTSTTSTTTTAFQYRWNTTGMAVAGNSSGVSGTAPNLLFTPLSVTLDSSNALYIGEYMNNRTQKWIQGASSGTTVAGQANGTSGTSNRTLTILCDVVLDSSNNMYISEQYNHRVIYWPNGVSSGTVVAGVSGVAGSANNYLNSPCGMYRMASSGTLYIADVNNHRIMQYLSGASSGTVVTGGNGAGTAVNQLWYPNGLTYDPSTNSLIIVNRSAQTIVRWVLGASSWTLLAGTIGTSGSTSTLLNGPMLIKLDPAGNIYIADVENHRIQFFYAGQSNGTTIAGVTNTPGTAPMLLTRPHSIALDSQLNLYVADFVNNRIQKFNRY